MDSHRLTLGPVLAILVLSQACTHLEVNKVSNGTLLWDRPGAISYSLPKKTFLIAETFLLAECPVADVSQPPDEKRNPPPRIESLVSVVPIIESDEDETYYIDSEKLRSWFKDTKLVIEHSSNQTLKTINGTITDQTGPMLTAVVGTAIKIAAAVVVLAQQPQKVVEVCTPKAVEALKQVAAKRKELADIVQRPSTPGDDAKIALLQKQIGRLIDEELTTKRVRRWSPRVADLKAWGKGTGRDAATIELKRDYEAVKQWLSGEGQTWLMTRARFDEPLVVVLDLPAWSHPKADHPQNSVVKARGLVLRNAALGTLWVCEGACPLPPAAPPPPPNPTPTPPAISVNNVLSATNVSVPQLGFKLLLPLENGLFQNSMLDLSLSEDGVVTKVGVQSASSVATGIKDLGASADAVKSAVDARNKAEADALSKAQNKARDENKVLAECLQAQKDIIKNGGTPIGSCQ